MSRSEEQVRPTVFQETGAEGRTPQCVREAPTLWDTSSGFLPRGCPSPGSAPSFFLVRRMSWGRGKWEERSIVVCADTAVWHDPGYDPLFTKEETEAWRG